MYLLVHECVAAVLAGFHETLNTRVPFVKHSSEKLPGFQEAVFEGEALHCHADFVSRDSNSLDCPGLVPVALGPPLQGWIATTTTNGGIA